MQCNVMQCNVALQSECNKQQLSPLSVCVLSLLHYTSAHSINHCQGIAMMMRVVVLMVRKVMVLMKILIIDKQMSGEPSRL